MAKMRKHSRDHKRHKGKRHKREIASDSDEWKKDGQEHYDCGRVFDAVYIALNIISTQLFAEVKNGQKEIKSSAQQEKEEENQLRFLLTLLAFLLYPPNRNRVMSRLPEKDGFGFAVFGSELVIS